MYDITNIITLDFIHIFGLTSHGVTAFFLMRFAHRLVEDPNYEEKIFNRTKPKKKYGSSKKSS